MELIKLGDGIETTECECPNCKSIFLYTKYDIWVNSAYDHFKSAYKNYNYVSCPVCNETITIDITFDEY